MLDLEIFGRGVIFHGRDGSHFVYVNDQVVLHSPPLSYWREGGLFIVYLRGDSFRHCKG